MSDETLITSVGEELLWDPKIDSESIAVSADNGTVTLRGTVGSFREKRQAKKAAERVYGVIEAENELNVRLMTGQKRDDADLRGDILQALMLDSIVPPTIDVAVNDGTVALTGTAESKFQVDEAVFIAGNIAGVIELYDEVGLTGPPPEAGDVEHDIKSAFKRNAKLDAEELTVETSDHSVTVKGTVRSWAEHDEAIDAAWAAQGVREVHDRIAVLY